MRASDEAPPLRARVVPWIAAGLLAVPLVWAACQPWTADHLGYALPGPQGLPHRLHAEGRHYDRGNTGQCQSRADLTATYQAPLVQIGVMVTLFGLPRPILGPHHRQGTTDTVLFVAASDGCYVAYALSGGP